MVRTMDCKHEHTIAVCTKCNDGFGLRWPDGTWYEGYVPEATGFQDEGHDNYMLITMCLDCQRVLGLPSIDDLRAAYPKIQEHSRRLTPEAPEEPGW